MIPIPEEEELRETLRRSTELLREARAAITKGWRTDPVVKRIDVELSKEPS